MQKEKLRCVFYAARHDCHVLITAPRAASWMCDALLNYAVGAQSDMHFNQNTKRIAARMTSERVPRGAKM